MSVIKSITPLYDTQQDRILIAVNAGQADECGFWLTRRLALATLKRLSEYLDRTSEMAAKVPLEFKLEVAAMERAAAVGATPLARTSNERIKSAAARSDLATKIAVTPHNGNFLLDLFGSGGAKISGGVTRSELQTILTLIKQEVVEADWLSMQVSTAQTDANSDVLESKKPRSVN